MTIRVKVTPNARTSEVLGWEEDPRAGRVMRIRIQAPPVEGKANKALIAFLARQLGLAKSAVKILKGETSRVKVVELPDGTSLPE